VLSLLSITQKKRRTEKNRTGPKKKAELGKLVNAPGHKSGI